MTEPPRSVLRLAAPLVISFWLRDAFQLIDLPYASLLGEGAVAAIGLTQPLGLLLIACWVGASNGLTARLADAMGRGEGERIEQLKRAARRIILVLSAFFVLIGLVIYRTAGSWGLDPEVAEPFRIYAAVFLIGRGVTSFWSILPDSLVKAHQDTRSTMWAGLISGVLNLVLNSLFVLVFEWGILGIALATAAASLGGLLYAIGRARRHERARVAAQRDLAPGVYTRPVRAILAISIPAALTFVLMAVESMTINGFLTGVEDETAALASWATFDRALRFLQMPIIAVGVALLPLVARLFGAGEHERIRSELRVALLAGSGYCLAFVWPVAWFCGPVLADLLFEDPTTNAWTRLGLSILPLAAFATFPIFLVRSTFEGMQRPLPGLVLSAVRTLVLVLPIAWLAMQRARHAGEPEITGAFTGLIVGAGMASCAMYVWVHRACQKRIV